MFAGRSRKYCQSRSFLVFSLNYRHLSLSTIGIVEETKISSDVCSLSSDVYSCILLFYLLRRIRFFESVCDNTFTIVVLLFCEMVISPHVKSSHLEIFLYGSESV